MQTEMIHWKRKRILLSLLVIAEPILASTERVMFIFRVRGVIVLVFPNYRNFQKKRYYRNNSINHYRP